MTDATGFPRGGNVVYKHAPLFVARQRPGTGKRMSIHAEPTTFALEARDVTKRYGALRANDRASIHVAKGSLHALVGENGAGKSTLCKTLFGLVQPDEGTLCIEEKPVVLTGPAQAMAAGIGMVHQHFMLVPPLTVAENVVLGVEPTRKGLLDHTHAERSVQALADQFGLQVDARARIEDLPVGVQQRVEILKVLHRGARTLILDEPTAVLTPPEVVSLFDVLRRLKAEGRTVLLVTHKLPEVLSLCDAVTVMRAGKTVGEQALAGLGVDDLARMMVGRNVDLSRKPRSVAPGAVHLEVQGLKVRRSDGRLGVDDVSLRVRAGEVVGIAGVEGNGQTELCDAITGVVHVEAGRVLLKGEDITSLSVRQRRERGMAHVPEDRLAQGLVPSMRAWENTALGLHRKPDLGGWGWLRRNAMKGLCTRLMKDFDVRPTQPALSAASFSGGNQQKLVMGRELHVKPRVLVLAQPTRGVDVGAIERIHAALLAASEAGMAILLISAELTELLSLSDVIHVMYRGRLVHTADGATATPELLGPFMLGGGAA